MPAMHEIEYQIYGDDLQFVEVLLDPMEAVVAEAGGMMYMEDGIEMETIFGDGSAQQGGLLGTLLGAGKRLLIGESLFMTVFLNRSPRKSKVAFGAPYPGKIVPVKLSDVGGELICQKDAFLCAAKGVSVGIAFQKRIGVGLFGGEGFIMERLQGDGWAFVHAGGTLLERTLAPGETLRVDTGCVVAYQNSVDFDIQYVGKVKSALFGGEGLFFATLRGPGRIWIQSLPLSRMADRIVAASPRAGGSRREEGSILGGLGGLLDGDNR
jgi:uncharacterized protein (TIGR00266 family)